MRILSTLVLIWLVIGAVAAFQRGYFSTADDNCSDVGTVVVTVAAGPLNYFGANPTVQCETPDVDSPDVDAPDVDAPDVDAPEVDAPDVDAPQPSQ